MDAEKPEDWLDDAPDFVPDPDAEVPDDWDEDEDGEWEAPQVSFLSNKYIYKLFLTPVSLSFPV